MLYYNKNIYIYHIIMKLYMCIYHVEDGERNDLLAYICIAGGLKALKKVNLEEVENKPPPPKASGG